MSPKFFIQSSDFRGWLTENHLTEKELLVGFYKVGSNKASMTWSQSVDEALCFGWIDGVRRNIDNESYSIRFTPRKKNSIWSTVNIQKVEILIEQGLMEEAGLAIYKHRKEEKSKVYSYENEEKILSLEFETAFKANVLAWDFFNTQAPSYKKTIIGWIMAAKRVETQRDRLEKTIQESEKQKRLR
jgi:uncharacterized protein YdeI (YjbR/CyaY-like superfamily)